MTDERCSRIVYIMKAIAIITVAMAHCTYSNLELQRLTDIVGTIGVPIFLITGGIYFSNKKPLSVFIVGKVKRIVVPWVLWGMLTYLLHSISDKELGTLKDLFLWMIGYMTWLYYVPVILICYIVFYFSTNKIYVTTIVGISLISWALTSFADGFNILMTECENPFNWIGFFAIGVLIRDRIKLIELDRKRLNYCLMLSGFILVILGICYYCVSANRGFTPSYWNAFSIIFELSACICCFFISYQISEFVKPSAVLVEVGKNSYPIFFSHMQIGMNLTNIVCMSFWNKLNGIEFGIVVFFRGIIVVAISYIVFVYLTGLFLKAIKLNKISWIIGL